MPPVQNITLEKLAFCAIENVIPHPIGIRVDEGKPILKLIAESKGTARLIEPGAGEYPR